MFNKTSSLEFLEFGEVFFEGTSEKKYHHGNHLLPVQNRDLIYLYKSNEDVYLRCIEGIALLVVSKDLNEENFQEFVIHRIVKINKNSYFNFIALSDKATIELALTNKTVIQNHFFQNDYHYKSFKSHIHFNELIAFYYNVRGQKYVFAGEMNQFWELTYVDSGTLFVSVDDKEFKLEKNQCILTPPKHIHKQHTTDAPSSYLTIVFDMYIDDIDAKKLMNRVFTIDRQTKRAIDGFISIEENPSHYDKELMLLYVKSIVLHLLKSTEESTHKVATTPMQQKFENELLEQVIIYINENIYTPFNVEDLCDSFAISRSSLQSLFKNNIGIAPKEYISNLKLKKSKELIKESKYTISEISTILGFSSIHYFSRRFKQKFGMNPTDYANKII